MSQQIGDLISREDTLTAFADYVGSGMSMDDYDALWDIVVKMPPKDRSVQDFVDKCRECGKQRQANAMLKDIKAEIKEWYWQADKQAIAKDPCVVDAMIDLFIRTIDAHISGEPQESEDDG